MIYNTDFKYTNPLGEIIFLPHRIIEFVVFLREINRRFTIHIAHLCEK